MKITSIKPSIVLLMSGALICGIAGCATQGYDRGAATAAALKTAADHTGDLSEKITGSLAALNTLTFQSQGDLRDPYNKFVGSVKDLQTASGSFDAKVAAMQAQAEAYFNNWSNQLSGIKNEQIRSIGKTQREDAVTSLASVNSDYKVLNSSFQPFMSDLTDIQTYLGADLTTGGLKAIQNVIDKTKTDAVPLRDSLQQLQSHMSALGATLSPVVSSGSQ